MILEIDKILALVCEIYIENLRIKQTMFFTFRSDYLEIIYLGMPAK